MREFGLRTTFVALILLVTLVAVVFGILQWGLRAQAGAGDVTLVAIDTNISGNDDTTVGTIDDCAEISTVGDTLTFDLVVVGVDEADKIKGYQFDIDYDPAVIRFGIDDDDDGLFEEDPGGDFADWVDNDGDTLVDEENLDHIDVDGPLSNPPDDVTIISRFGSGGGVGFLHLSDTQTGGSATLAAGDGTAAPAPPANHEWGDGVLARFTVTAVGPGTTPLLMPSVVQDADVIDGGVDIDDDGNVDSDDDGTLANAVFGFDIVETVASTSMPTRTLTPLMTAASG
jgi:hypothetical protein